VPVLPALGTGTLSFVIQTSAI